MTTTTKDIARALDAKVEAIADEGLRARCRAARAALEQAHRAESTFVATFNDILDRARARAKARNDEGFAEAMERGDFIEAMSGGEEFEDDDYLEALEEAAKSAPEPLRAAVVVHQAKRDEFNGWHEGKFADADHAGLVLGRVIGKEARVTGALRAFAEGLVTADAVLHEMVLCQQAYARTIASGVPNRFNGEWPS
jgi:hypothetical protein